MLGVLAAAGIPAQPEGPALACRIRLTGAEASVQVTGSDATATNWVAFGKFTQPAVQENGKVDQREVRRCLGRRDPQPPGPRSGDQGLRPERKGQADLPDSDRERVATDPQRAGAGRDGEQGRRSAQGAVGHRHSSAAEACSFPTSEDVVKTLGLKKGIKVLALDLSGL